MPNLDFSVRRDPPDIVTSVKAFGHETRNQVRGIVAEAARRGAAEARLRAPQGPPREKRDGGTIRDSIQVRNLDRGGYMPGGAGGGGIYESRFFADSRIAPHLRYVVEGTRGPIFPRPPRRALKLAGRGNIYRAHTEGQRANARWWDEAERATNEYVARAIREFRVPER